jgi:parallel beta-helix repeat protein
MKSSSGSTIDGNTLSNNEYGFYIWFASGNNIYHNNIIDNTIQVKDYGTNTWDNGIGEGNYWSDYDGVDEDENGIGDTPYIIDSDSQDNYPLMEPFE